MEVSEYLVGSPAFKAGGTGDPRTAGSIPVHLRQFLPKARIGGATYSRKARSGPGGASTRAAVGYPGDVSARQRRNSSSGRPVRAESIPSQLWATWARAGGMFLLLFSLLFTAPLGAQARVLESSPADGESIATLEVITLEFDTLLRPDDASVTVFRRDGTEIVVTSVVIDRATLTARIGESVPSGNYVISYAVEGSDGALNEGELRVSVDSPDQALSGGLIAVIGVAVVMFGLLAVVFSLDKKRRPGGQAVG